MYKVIQSLCIYTGEYTGGNTMKKETIQSTKGKRIIYKKGKSQTIGYSMEYSYDT